MKKLFSLVLICSTIAASTANAQTENYFGPKKGDFAITVGAEPVINFVGNMFNGNTDNSLSGIGGSLAGKYFFGDRFAITAGIGINNFKTTDFTFNPEDEDFKEVISKDIEGDNNFSLNVGAQYYFRPGKRIQPFVGADIYFGRENSNYSIDKDFDAYYNTENYWGNTESIRQYDTFYKRSSPTNMFGILANVGIEIFIVKSVSISAACDFGVQSYTQKSISKFKTDDNSYTYEDVEERNYNKKTGKRTYFGTGLMNGNIAFNFYF